MSDEHKAKQDARRARLEDQLRENLKRRKEQARARRNPSNVPNDERQANGMVEDED